MLADQIPRADLPRVGRSAAATRSRAPRRRGRGLMLPPREGVYAAVPVCTPSEWLYALEGALSAPHVEALRRRLRVAGPDTVLAAAREWADAADRLTGRDVAVSHATVAAAIGYAEATVKRIMRFLSRLGFVVECARGRNRLTLDELARARDLGATQQRAAASTRALTIPRSVDGTPLPLTQPVPRKSHLGKNSPTRARGARKAVAPRRPAEDERTSAQFDQPRWPLAIQRFSAELTARLPRLLRTATSRPTRMLVNTRTGPDGSWVGGRHIGHVCEAVMRHRLVERGWTVDQLLRSVDRHQATLRRVVEPDEQRDPLAWLFAMIRAAIAPTDIAPSQRLAAERQRRRDIAARAHAAEAATRERLEQERPEIDAIIAQMHRQFRTASHSPAG